MAKLTTEEFIKKAQEAHGDRYDYSKVDNEHGAMRMMKLRKLLSFSILKILESFTLIIRHAILQLVWLLKKMTHNILIFGKAAWTFCWMRLVSVFLHGLFQLFRLNLLKISRKSSFQDWQQNRQIRWFSAVILIVSGFVVPDMNPHNTC